MVTAHVQIYNVRSCESDSEIVRCNALVYEPQMVFGSTLVAKLQSCTSSP